MKVRESRAQYILRFDDLCPTMDRSRWERFKALITEFKLRPILAIVPDNQDSNLNRAPTDPVFWAEMRAMQSAGATIALHGYQHLCVSVAASLVALNDSSEFAGVEEHTQGQWIQAGIKILRERGLDPTLWVAPNHGFDHGTVRALLASGIKMLSDGQARVPFKRKGMLWIPQQLWGPVEKPAGIWTICIHSNTARFSEIEELARFLHRNADQFTSVERVAEEFDAKAMGVEEYLYACYALWRIRFSRLRRRKRMRNSGFKLT